jgi:hypothetical protein
LLPLSAVGSKARIKIIDQAGIYAHPQAHTLANPLIPWHRLLPIPQAQTAFNVKLTATSPSRRM